MSLKLYIVATLLSLSAITSSTFALGPFEPLMLISNYGSNFQDELPASKSIEWNGKELDVIKTYNKVAGKMGKIGDTLVVVPDDEPNQRLLITGPLANQKFYIEGTKVIFSGWSANPPPNVRLKGTPFELGFLSLKEEKKTEEKEATDSKQQFNTTTWIVVRHADREGSKDALSEAGKIRAAKLVEIASLLRVTEVYSTDWVRTKTTAQPTADKLELEVQTYKKHDEKTLAALKQKHAGGVILMVGHSNTIGHIVNGLGGKGDFSVGHDDYDDLFIVTTDDKTTRALRLKFGD